MILSDSTVKKLQCGSTESGNIPIQLTHLDPEAMQRAGAPAPCSPTRCLRQQTRDVVVGRMMINKVRAGTSERHAQRHRASSG